MKRKPFQPNRNQQGQVIIEYILMMIVMLTLSFMIQNFLRESEFIKSFTFSPWGRLNGMIQCGTWNPCGVEVAAPGLHPNTAERVLSLDPKTL